jgi:hypothetical protein
MKEASVQKTELQFSYFGIDAVSGDSLQLMLSFSENRNTNQSACAYTVFCTGEGISGVQDAKFTLSNCSGEYTYDVSWSSEDGMTNSGTVLIPVIDLEHANRFVVMVKTNGVEQILARGKFFYI